jgi:hypothetical protein
LQQCFRRVLWKSPSELSALAQISPGTRANETIVLSVYSVASTLYRLAVIAIIMMLVLRFSGSAGFGIPAVLLVGLFLIMGARRWLEPIIRPPQGPRHRQGRMSRPVLVASACLAVLTAALCLPFPCSIRTGLLIEPAREVDVYVSTPGFVVKAISPGANVRAGDRIVELFNWQAKLQQLQIEGEARQLEAGLKALSVRRVLDPMAALRMPGSQEKLAATRERLSVVAEEVARLIVRAPRSGRVFAAGIRSATETQHHDQRFDWDGGPLDPNNVGAYMPEGTLLCRVGDEMLREAKMLVRQTEVELIRSGQQVSFTLPGYRLGQLVGKVESVSPTSVNEVSPELAAAGWIATHRRSDGTLRPAGVYYEVRVSWDEGQPIPPARLVGPGRIHVGPMSAARRIRRFVAENFRFQ